MHPFSDKKLGALMEAQQVDLVLVWRSSLVPLPSGCIAAMAG